MLNNILTKFWSVRHQFAKYFIIGISGVMLDIGTLFILKEYLNLRPINAVIINQILVINYSFLLNKLWAFGAGGQAHKQMIKFFILMGANYLFSIAWMFILNEKLAINYLIARLSNVVLAVSWNFLIYKFWVFKISPQSSLE